MTKPIFFDSTGRRGIWARRAVAALLLVIIIGAVAFATTLIRVTPDADLALPLRQTHAAHLTLSSRLRQDIKNWLPVLKRHHSQKPLNVGFYVPDDEASIASLRRHVGELNWVVPAMISVTGPGHKVQIVSDPHFDRMISAMRRPPKILPMVQNIGGSGNWDGANTARLFANTAASQRLAQSLANRITAQRQAGVVLDFESLPPQAMPGYLRFMRMLRATLPAGAKLAVTAPVGEEAWPLPALAKIADHVILMAYDQHWQGGEAGPIASQDWFVRQVEKGQQQIGRDKIIVALGSYGYDWHGDGTDALSIEEAWLAAHDSDAPVTFDPVSGNAGFAYDDGDKHHQVWMLDAATSWNQLQALHRLGIQSVALWRLGSEDPGFWTGLSAFRSGTRPDLSRIASSLNTDVEGSGEILRITATPTDGRRETLFDRQGMIERETYRLLPTPYQVQRTGAQPKMLALTFDDGPDATWTPKILDVLERAGVPATFFVIGENALQHPQLLRRMMAHGDEIGNHTYLHPNLANASATETNLELNATQRLVQAYVGRSMRFFRAPYFGDAEPTTADELLPALAAQQAGYTVVGLHVDPNDWQQPGVDAIVRQVVDQVHAATPDRSANIILLHDGGGNREQTVAALPQIITRLRAEGYSFVPVSRLAGLSPAQAMPPVKPGDLMAVRIDVGVFIVLAIVMGLFVWIFYVAIALGIARAILMAGLAWFQSRRDRVPPPVYQPSVSVIIPAYNEERVIEASVRLVLASDYPDLQVIVADDGSKDGTSAIVTQAFADDPRVTLLTLHNGGKASALNRALTHAKGDVIIALDADTQFEAHTIRRLARWFADPAIGAVAGDARVGNRVNLVTRWQAIEYITAQNLERKALAGFDAMTVVPGAVGAWRRAALDDVGGYPEDTLAEDQDLTIAIQRADWRVTYDPQAVAWTEAPEGFRALAKQRYRWAFGTLQCLWKHAAILRRGRPTGLALVGLPQAWLFQIAFAAISPLIDLALLISIGTTILQIQQHGWAQTSGDVATMAIYWLVFTAIDVACGWVAYRLDGRKLPYPAHLLVAQRFVYRQIMYWVVIRAIASAIGGWVVGWGKLERSGRVAGNESATTSAPERS
ncbi:glycosyltransferase [Sphingobium sp.]|uniref:glycosyltransferase n=1 Tax=Sphingobium sp. TaxID=1912891 RepID=UPI003BB5AB48